jgi:hypothetical protein
MKHYNVEDENIFRVIIMNILLTLFYDTMQYHLEKKVSHNAKNIEMKNIKPKSLVEKIICPISVNKKGQ